MPFKEMGEPELKGSEPENLDAISGYAIKTLLGLFARLPRAHDIFPLCEDRAGVRQLHPDTVRWVVAEYAKNCHNRILQGHLLSTGVRTYLRVTVRIMTIIIEDWMDLEDVTAPELSVMSIRRATQKIGWSGGKVKSALIWASRTMKLTELEDYVTDPMVADIERPPKPDQPKKMETKKADWHHDWLYRAIERECETTFRRHEGDNGCTENRCHRSMWAAIARISCLGVRLGNLLSWTRHISIKQPPNDIPSAIFTFERLKNSKIKDERVYMQFPLVSNEGHSLVPVYEELADFLDTHGVLAPAPSKTGRTRYEKLAKKSHEERMAMSVEELEALISHGPDYLKIREDNEGVSEMQIHKVMRTIAWATQKRFRLLGNNADPVDIQYLDLSMDRITGHSNRAWFVTCMQQMGFTDSQQSQCLGWALQGEARMAAAYNRNTLGNEFKLRLQVIMALGPTTPSAEPGNEHYAWASAAPGALPPDPPLREPKDTWHRRMYNRDERTRMGDWDTTRWEALPMCGYPRPLTSDELRAMRSLAPPVAVPQIYDSMSWLPLRTGGPGPILLPAAYSQLLTR